jgi:methanol dehydrogenase (cytochrome c) subunit 2
MRRRSPAGAATNSKRRQQREENSMRVTYLAAAIAAGFIFATAPVGGAYAYDGTKCKAAGNCWEPKPGFPDKIEGSKYDPKHDPKELAKQQTSIQAMEERNKKRVAYFKKSGKWIYEVDKIPND